MRNTSGADNIVTRTLPSDCRIARFSSHVPLGNSASEVELSVEAARPTMLEVLGDVIGPAFTIVNKNKRRVQKVDLMNILSAEKIAER